MRAIVLVLVLFLLPVPHQAAIDPASIDQAWSVLRDAASDKSSDKRAKAMHALGLLRRDPRAQQMAEKALGDENADVQVEAAKALGEMDAVSARAELRRALTGKDIRVVLAAANALYALKDPEAYDVFYALLTGERKSGVGLLQSQLDMLKDRRAIEKLAFETGIGFVPFGSMSYEAFKTITHDSSTPVRVAAAGKLAKDPDPKSGQALARSCADKKWQVRAASADAIAVRSDPRLLHAVVPLLLDENDTVRCEAAATVIRLSLHAPKRRAKEK